jgi:hypothetical protein
LNSNNIVDFIFYQIYSYYYDILKFELDLELFK